MRGRTTTIATVLGLLTACGGSSPVMLGGATPPVLERPPEVVLCGFGAKPLAGLQQDHWAQWCERSREMHGPYERYAHDGTLIVSGEFFKNKPVGKWQWFHPGGERLLAGTYEDGSPVGEWEWRHANGETAQRGAYTEGLRSGQWVTYFDDRTPASEGPYAEGQRDGEWSYWNAGSQLLRTQTWKAGALTKDETPEAKTELIGP